MFLHTIDQRRAQKQVSTRLDTENPVCALPYSVSVTTPTDNLPRTRPKNYVLLEPVKNCNVPLDPVKICNNTFPHFNAFEVHQMQIYP